MRDRKTMNCVQIRKPILFQLTKFIIISLGRIVRIMRSKQVGKEVLGIGRVVALKLTNSDVNPIPPHLVPLVVSAMESWGNEVLKVAS